MKASHQSRRAIAGFCGTFDLLLVTAVTGSSLAVCLPLSSKLISSGDTTPLRCLTFLTVYGLFCVLSWGLGRAALDAQKTDRLSARILKGMGRAAATVSGAIVGGGFLPALYTLLVLLYYTVAYFHAGLPPL